MIEAKPAVLGGRTQKHDTGPRRSRRVMPDRTGLVGGESFEWLFITGESFEGRSSSNKNL